MDHLEPKSASKDEIDSLEAILCLPGEFRRTDDGEYYQ